MIREVADRPTKMVAVTQMSTCSAAWCREGSGPHRPRGGFRCWSTARSRRAMDVDVRDIDCDFFVITGTSYTARPASARSTQHEHLAAMPPFNGGGEMIRDVHTITSAMACRRTGSRPGRRRSSSDRARRGHRLHQLIGKSRIRAHEIRCSPMPSRNSRDQSLRIIGTAAEKAPSSRSNESAHAHDFATVIDAPACGAGRNALRHAAVGTFGVAAPAAHLSRSTTP